MEIVYIHRLAMESWQMLSGYQDGVVYIYTSQAGSGILTDVERVVRMEIVIFHRLAVGSWQLLIECQDGVVYIYCEERM